MKHWLKQLTATIIVCASCAMCLPGAVSAKATEKGRYPTNAGDILVTPNNENKLAKIFKLGHAGLVLNKSTSVEATLPRVTS